MNKRKIIFPLLVVLSLQLEVFSQVEFRATHKLGCDSLTTTFTALINGTPATNVTATAISWDFGDGNTSNSLEPTHQYSDTGKYTVKVIINNTDSITKLDFIKIFRKPKANFHANDSGNIGFFVMSFYAQNPDSSNRKFNYVWDFGDGEKNLTNDPATTHLFKASGKYFITLRTELYDLPTCYNDTTKPLLIETKEIDAPNFISPNNDGINDLFIIEGDAYTQLTFNVFSKWGNMVFTRTSPNIIWDGRSSLGQDLQSGVYYFTVVSQNGGLKKKGTLYLVR